MNIDVARVRLRKLAADSMYRVALVSAVSRLAWRRDPVRTRLFRALVPLVNGRVDAEERGWRSLIEARRQTLLADPQVLEIDDFGTHQRRRRVVGELCLGTAKTPRQAQLLMRLARAHQSRSAIELGASVGISSSYIAAGQQLHGGGQVTTIEGAASVAEVARQTAAAVGVGTRVVTGRFDDVLDDTLEAIPPVDFAFIDGHHDEVATLRYWRRILRSAEKGAWVVLDDIRWSAGMLRAWRTVAASSDVAVAVDLGTVGVCVTRAE